MNAAQHLHQFEYRVAEEVVVRLAGVTAFDLDAGRELAAPALPPWTIADITALLDADAEGAERYAIHFRHGDTTCIATVSEEAIEGTA